MGGQLAQGVAKLLPLGNLPVLNAIALAEAGKVDRLRRGKKLLKRGFKLRNGQHFKDAAAVVVNQQNGEAALEVATG